MLKTLVIALCMHGALGFGEGGQQKLHGFYRPRSSRGAAASSSVPLEAEIVPGGFSPGGRAKASNQRIFAMLLPPKPSPEPPMPKDPELVQIALLFQGPRALAKNFFIGTFLFDLYAKRHGPAMVATAAAARAWFWPMYLVAPTLDHLGKTTKRDGLNHPEVTVVSNRVAKRATCRC